jgi:hypothetical protein
LRNSWRLFFFQGLDTPVGVFWEISERKSTQTFRLLDTGAQFTMKDTDSGIPPITVEQGPF